MNCITRGSYKDTVKISNTIERFLRIELNFASNFQKTLIIFPRKTPIFFSGFFIKKYRKNIEKWNSVVLKTKIPRKIILKTSLKVFFEKATLNGFFKKCHNKFIPITLACCVNLNHQNILRYYNFVIYRIFNSYFFANTKKPFIYFVREFRLSCARTLALKYKLCNASKIYKKFGFKLKFFDGNILFFIQPTFQMVINSKHSVVILDKL